MRTRLEVEEHFADRAALNGVERLFFVGIGGAGMSGMARLARWMHGVHVEGSDRDADSPDIAALRQEGFTVHKGHHAEPVEEFAVGRCALVLTDAIDLPMSPEVAVARRLGIPLIRRSVLLGWLVKNRRVIAVTGTHGKTTTTGLVGAGLVAAGLDPLVVVGAAVPDFGGPIRYGSGEWAVVEACEAYDGFHDLDAEVVVLTNLEPDHLDYHLTWENLRESVKRFLDKLPENGVLLYDAADEGAATMAAEVARPSFGYGPIEGVDMTLPGRKNAINAGGALAAAQAVGADPEAARQGIAAFSGSARRLQTIFDGDITVIDDYAHHPTEIDASIESLRARFPGRRLVVVYQPHLYSRTKDHLPGFATALDAADLVVLTDIYPAREDPIPGISSARIAAALTTPHRYVPARQALPREVVRWVEPGDVVVGMGAGTISHFPKDFVEEWARPKSETLKIVVLQGGDNPEREVSLLSGAAVAEALRLRGHHVRQIDLTPGLLESGDLSSLTGKNRPDVVFLAVHGVRQEDGCLQGLLELMRLPYTGSGVLASAQAMDKDATKRILAAHGLPVARGVAVRRGDPPPAWTGPVIVKPNTQGSTVGLSFVETESQLEAAIARALAYDEVALVEEWLKGTELTAPVLLGEALPVIEIVPKSGAYDFEMKYTPGATEEIIPARISEGDAAKVREMAVRAHRALGCEGATRTDFILTANGPVILEVNTLPGLTGTSLLPTSAAAAGISMEELCERLVRDALGRHAQA